MSWIMHFNESKKNVVDYHAIWLDVILYQHFYDLNIFNLGLCSNAIISKDKYVKPMLYANIFILNISFRCSITFIPSRP